MGNAEKTSASAAKLASRALKDPKTSASHAKSVAGSALTEESARASAGSKRVIKDVSNEHREALKRLVDR